MLNGTAPGHSGEEMSKTSRTGPPSGARRHGRPVSCADDLERRCNEFGRLPGIWHCMQTVRWLPVVFITAVIGWGYYAYVIELCFYTVPYWWERLLYLVPAHIILILFLWSYYICIFARIGRPPDSFRVPADLARELADAPNTATFNGLLEQHASRTRLPVTMRSPDMAIRYCDKCQVIKPDRAHHCSICGHCVLKFDHHCPWVNTCINYRNYKFFIQFLGYALLLCIWSSLTLLKYFIWFWTEGIKQKDGAKFHIVFLFFASSMFSISVSILFFYHLWLSAKNRSTLESFRAPMFNYGPDKNGFNLGCRRNYEEVFGPNKLVWFLPIFSGNQWFSVDGDVVPYRSTGDGTVYPVRMATEVEYFRANAPNEPSYGAATADGHAVELGSAV